MDSLEDRASKYHGKEVQKQIKLFPGYVLINTDAPEEIHKRLEREKDYIKILENDAGYVPLTAEEETIIRHFATLEGETGVSIGLIKDGVLTVLDGSLKGMEDKIVRIDRHRRKAWVHFDHLLGESRVLSFYLNVIKHTT